MNSYTGGGLKFKNKGVDAAKKVQPTYYCKPDLSAVDSKSKDISKKHKKDKKDKKDKKHKKDKKKKHEKRSRSPSQEK